MRNNIYLQRYATPGPHIESFPDKNLSLVVVIPACAEPDLRLAIASLLDCQPPEGTVEVVVVINHSEEAGEEIRGINQRAWQEIHELKQKAPGWMRIFPVKAYDQPKKHAGVGLARKVGMDEAVRRFEQLRGEIPDIHQKGIIVCYDADCACDVNYLQAIKAHFDSGHTSACSIYYEHPLQGSEHSEYVYAGIVQYELYLRYYVDALRWAGYPYAWQTVGSAIAVLSSVYQQQGGMNLRKAGEDFYFLQKLFPLPGFSELNNTRVIPSPRISDRVPFGTGKVIGDWVGQQKDTLFTYSPEAFDELKTFMKMIPVLYQAKEFSSLEEKLPSTVKNYLRHRNFAKELTRIRTNAGDYQSFRKQFFAWFGGLKVLQFFHYARNHHEDVPIVEAAQWLMKEMNQKVVKNRDAKSLLLDLREIDRNWNYQL